MKQRNKTYTVLAPVHGYQYERERQGYKTLPNQALGTEGTRALPHLFARIFIMSILIQLACTSPEPQPPAPRCKWVEKHYICYPNKIEVWDYDLNDSLDDEDIEQLSGKKKRKK